MTAQPVWITPPGSLGTIPEGVFYEVPLQAYVPDDSGSLHFEVIAGQLPAGIQCAVTGLLQGVPQAVADISGVPLPVSEDVESKFVVRVFTTTVINNQTIYNRLADRTFTLTVAAQNIPEWVTPPGQIAEYYDGSLVNGLQLDYTTVVAPDIAFTRLVAGALPPGLTLSPTGLISGFIAPNIVNSAPPNFDMTPFDQYPFDFTAASASTNYEFVLEVFDAKGGDLRTFSIFVISRDSLTADTTEFTADNTFITADVSPFRPPIILNPEGSIGTVRNDNFFAYQFTGIDLDQDQFRYVAYHYVGSTLTAGTGIPGLTLDLNSGWLYGYIPNLGLTDNLYNFVVQAYQVGSPDIISPEYQYSLSVIGPLDTDITWLTPSDLGYINNGATSTFYVAAINTGGIPLSYRLKGLQSGDAPVYNRLPQGLELLSSGNIAGRVSFDTFALDGGTTTFDVRLNNGPSTPTTFDMKCTFTVNAYSSNGAINVYKTFSITVVRAYNEPYDNLYIQAMPPQNDRDYLSSLLQNSEIFPPSLLYRADDPNFGVARNVVYQHAYGLTASTIDLYFEAVLLNHYWKELVLGSLETAQAIDPITGEVVYEVVYSQIIDNLVNNSGESVGKEVTLPYEILSPDSTEITTVYPNSLVNMRTQVIDTVGQISNILPLWMLSKQSNGSVLGFTPAWILAYTKPGSSGQVKYNIQTTFGSTLNVIDFTVDRFTIDRLLSKNWDPVNKEWIPTPATITTFDVGSGDLTDVGWQNQDDETVVWVSDDDQPTTWTNNSGYYPEGTIFDANSLQFIDPVDMYSNTTAYDKYVVFPKRNILE